MPTRLLEGGLTGHGGASWRRAASTVLQISDEASFRLFLLGQMLDGPVMDTHPVNTTIMSLTMGKRTWNLQSNILTATHIEQ